ncbi:MAG: hypothetical protein JWM72_4562 [Actinomycetia bacterium]|nr:hypothetical protein [Actinomycetes bacterium]
MPVLQESDISYREWAPPLAWRSVVSYMSNEVRRLSGTTPTALLAERGLTS